MLYVHTNGPKKGYTRLERQLIEELENGRRVLWLVCGGSNIAGIIQVMKNIPDRLTGGLVITLTDERYGPIGHADSNWRQLVDAGFEPKQAKTLPVLQPGMSLDETVEHYHELAHRAFDDADTVIATFGIGADGHIAGILPGSPAADEEEQWAAGYDGGSFQRLTLTFPALRHIDTAYALSFGEAKKAALTRLQSENLLIKDQPAQILKELPEVYLYSDQIKEEK